MEYRNLGNSGLKVPVLSLGTATFGGTNEFFKRWGQTGVEEAKRLVDICLDKGVNFLIRQMCILTVTLKSYSERQLNQKEIRQ